MRRRWPQSLVAWLALVGPACDQRPASGPIPVHPVSGLVIYKGKPVPDALVAFYPAGAPAPGPSGPGADGPPRPTGKTDAEGKFKLYTYVGDDGAPEGDYKVTVSFAGSAETRNLMAKDASKTVNVALPARYADPARSGLTATVKPDATEVPPFDLK